MKSINFTISKSVPSKELTNSIIANVNSHFSYAKTKFKVCRAADLSITNSFSMTKGFVYEDFTYTIKILNNGPSNATSVTLINNLPCNCICKSINLSKGSYTYYKNKITCYIEEISYGEEVTIDITIIPTSLCTLTNSVFVIANEYDNTYKNNFLVTNTRVFFRWPNLQESIPFIWIILLLLHNK